VYHDMRAAKDRVEDELLTYDGVVGVDIGYKEVRGHPTETLAIRVLVEKKKKDEDIRAGQRVPEAIDEFPTDVIERGITRFAQDIARYDPLVGGMSGGTCGGVLGSGTLGAVVRDLTTGQLGLLSNWHVVVGGVSGPAGLTVAQPAPFDNGNCISDVVGQVTRSAINEDVDCAVVMLNSSRPAINAILDIGTLNAPGTLGATSNMIGWTVVKRGRTTALTYGTIDTVDGTVKVLDAGVERIFKRQIGIWRIRERNWSFGGPGDSGSVVVDLTNRRVIGLFFAVSNPPFMYPGAYGWANHISAVRYSLNVDIFAPKSKEKDKEKDKEGEKLTGEKLTGEKLILKEEDKLSAEALVGDRSASAFAESAARGHDDGPMSERLARLEASVEELRHFILSGDRPDVSRGVSGNAGTDESSPDDSEGKREA
jgi:hypothetical protein